MPELHLVGQVIGASEFNETELFCKWEFETSNSGHWSILEGKGKGQTQVGVNDNSGLMTSWMHPIDIHYTTTSIHGWPKLRFEVWRLDSFGRGEICACGMIIIPCAPGMHTINCLTWRPEGTFSDEISSKILGGYPQLAHKDKICSNSNRFDMHTITCGKVHVELQVLLKDLESKGVRCC